MLDRNLLHALKERKRFNTLEYAVPQGAFDQDTVNMIKWFKRYFERYTEHESIDIDTLETFIKLEGKLNDDQHAIIKSLLRGLREPVGDHQRRQTAAFNDVGRDAEHLFRGLGIKCRCMFVKQQQFRVGHGSHEQCQRLPLSAGEQADFRFQPVFQTKIQ